jgi:hypothetical protein
MQNVSIDIYKMPCSNSPITINCPHCLTAIS